MRKKLLIIMMTAVMAATGIGGSAANMAGASGVKDVAAVSAKTAKKKALTADQVLSKIKKSMKTSYTCDNKLKMSDGITYYDLDKSKVESMAYEANSNSSINMDVAVVVKVKKGYADTARAKLQKSLTQTVDYNKLYNMDTLRVNQARIFVKGNYVGMFILGKKASDKLSVQKQAKIAKSEAAKIDKAWKSVFGGNVKNFAKVN
ncbi:DUF4358 domain-containing protein [Eubacterium sp. MSJ-13]|uniref:DUF4358 domain-containing protein n=1 Tax=Eubacterium sp. MSJ-13 TaxID=2841513 RepID=UPI001C10A6F9|nr:DUF4358 domain-containing protein [Eubacterium sp. MSJ-13]MBU5478121.1 DUF4358 domain-containing protein [Eubacterium sp. MSJ-13]